MGSINILAEYLKNKYEKYIYRMKIEWDGRYESARVARSKAIVYRNQARPGGV